MADAKVDRSCLLVVADYPYVVVRERAFAPIPWDESLARLYLGTFSRILLLGRFRKADVAPEGWFPVDGRHFEVLDAGDWASLAGFVSNVPRLLRALRACWGRVDVLQLRLFYLNSLVTWAYNRAARGGSRPVTTLLVGDSASALLLRTDLLPWAWARRAGAVAVTWVLRAVQARVDLAVFVATFLQDQFGASGVPSVVANESWLHADMIHRHERHEARHPCTVLVAARLVPLKRVNLLLEAIATLRAQGEEVRCVVVGDGPERGALERQAASPSLAGRVTFPGWLRLLGPDMLAAYDAADVFCLPSFSEGLPLVLIEAMARGVPVVATGVSGTPELVAHEQSGLLIARDDLAALVEAIRRLIHDRVLWRRCVDGGYETAGRHTFEIQRGRLAAAITALATN